MFHILTLFGRDRAIYLADNGHSLEEFLYHEGEFEGLETRLKNKYGDPKRTFLEVGADYESSYYIDKFEDLVAR